MAEASAVCWSRREIVTGLGALAAATLTGCAPARILLGAAPAEFGRDPGLDERVLAAFVATVIPGASSDLPDPTRVFGDPFYPFHRYRTFFAGDLWRRGRTLFPGRPFDELPLDGRTEVIQRGLRADGVTRRLYNGAIVLVQVASYGGIYSTNGDVSLIDFHGFRYGASHPGSSSHPDPGRFLAPRLALDGNPA